MTILWADGFDHYGDDETQMLAGSYADNTGITLQSSIVRTGARAIQMGSTNGNGIRRAFGGAKTTVGAGMAFYASAIPSSNDNRALFRFANAANNNQVTIWLQSTGALEATTGAFNTSLGATDGPVFPATSWVHVEAKVHIDASAGTVEVRVNGVTVLNLTGQNTDPYSTGETSQLFSGSLSTHFTNFYGDDLYAWDTSGTANNDFIGDKKVFTDFPDADTADQDWTPDSGTDRYARIDENPADGDTSYDSSDNAGDKMGVTFPALDASVTTVTAVLFVYKARKTDAGDCTVETHCDSSGDVADGAPIALTTTYTYYSDAYDVDPHTGAPWTNSGASNAAMQLERTL